MHSMFYDTDTETVFYALHVTGNTSRLPRNRPVPQKRKCNDALIPSVEPSSLGDRYIPLIPEAYVCFQRESTNIRGIEAEYSQGHPMRPMMVSVRLLTVR